MNNRCLSVIVICIVIVACTEADGNQTQSHNLVKRQFPSRGGTFSLSRRRQFPPPEELEEESEEYETSEEEVKGPGFRGRQPPPSEEDYDYAITEAPRTTTPAPPKPTSRTSVFNSRLANRPRFGASLSSTSKPSTEAPKPPQSPARGTPAQSQPLDVVASILNRPPPPRPASSRAIAPAAKPANEVASKPSTTGATEAPNRRNGVSRVRTRGRLRTRSTTTTTTTTTTKKPEEDYYYYYEDSEESQEQKPIATTTTTTTTTAPKTRSPFRIRPAAGGTGARSTTSKPKPVVKFDIESQFAPPPEEPLDPLPQQTSAAPKRFTTSTTPAGPPADGIPAHLRHKYRPRTDGRFIDFLRDPNRPRELKGHDLTDYPFYIVVPDDIDFECDDRKDGYYASIPHKCQLFHYCFAGARYDFLCANYTLYDQTTFTCRFANNVDCEASAQHYNRNDDLWKETTTTAKPETTTRRRRKSTPKEEEYDDEDYYEDDYEEEEPERRRRPPKRRRNRRKNRRNQSDE